MVAVLDDMVQERGKLMTYEVCFQSSIDRTNSFSSDHRLPMLMLKERAWLASSGVQIPDGYKEADAAMLQIYLWVGIGANFAGRWPAGFCCTLLCRSINSRTVRPGQTGIIYEGEELPMNNTGFRCPVAAVGRAPGEE